MFVTTVGDDAVPTLNDTRVGRDNGTHPSLHDHPLNPRALVKTSSSHTASSGSRRDMNGRLVRGNEHSPLTVTGGTALTGTPLSGVTVLLARQNIALASELRSHVVHLNALRGAHAATTTLNHFCPNAGDGGLTTRLSPGALWVRTPQRGCCPVVGCHDESLVALETAVAHNAPCAVFHPFVIPTHIPVTQKSTRAVTWTRLTGLTCAPADGTASTTTLGSVVCVCDGIEQPSLKQQRKSPPEHGVVFTLCSSTVDGLQHAGGVGCVWESQRRRRFR